MLVFIIIIMSLFLLPKFVNFSRKNKKIENQDTFTSSSLNEIVFKNTEKAFEYACEFLDTDISSGHPLLAIVLEVRNNIYALKISNTHDSKIPTTSLRELKEQKQELSYICPSARKAYGLPELKKGDLVIWQSISQFPHPYIAGLIIGKALPIYDIEEGGWVLAS